MAESTTLGTDKTQKVTIDGIEYSRIVSKNTGSSLLPDTIPSFHASSENSTLSVIALRRAEFLQRYKEIKQSGDMDYASQIDKHWGVKVNSKLSGKCTYLGGTSSNIEIGDVVNQNLTGDATADIAGKGTAAGRGSIDYDVKEHCIIIGVYHCVPLLDYDSSVARRYAFKSEIGDYAQPEFDRLGMEQIPLSYLFPWNFSEDGDIIGTDYRKVRELSLGYAPRYFDYKIRYDVIRGEFNKSLLSWVAPLRIRMISDYFMNQQALEQDPHIDYSFFKVNPSVVDPIFAVNSDEDTKTDQLMVNMYFDVKAVRNLDYDGLPY